MSKPPTVCANCLVEPSPLKRNFGLKSKLKGRNFTVQDALEGLYSFTGEPLFNLTEVTEGSYSRYLCTDCANHIGTGYAQILKFNNRRKTGSFVADRLEAAKVNISATTTPVEPVPQPLNKKEIKKPTAGQTIKDIYSNKRSAKIFRSYVKSFVSREVQNLLKNQMFTKEKLGRDMMPSNQEMETVLLKEAPLIYKVLHGLVLKNQRTVKFKPVMRTILGIALASRNRHANQFQKYIGLTLFTGNSRAIYETLLKLDISCCLKTADRMATQLCTGFEEPSKEVKLEQLTPYLEEWNLKVIKDSTKKAMAVDPTSGEDEHLSDLDEDPGPLSVSPSDNPPDDNNFENSKDDEQDASPPAKKRNIE